MQDVTYYSKEEGKIKCVDTADEATHILLVKEDYDNLTNRLVMLDRIHTEILNAKRGLNPKKERSGYYVKFCNEKYMRCISDGVYGYRSFGKCWEYLISTPIFLSVNLADARFEAENYLDHFFGFAQYYDNKQRWDSEEDYFCSELLMHANTHHWVWEVSFIVPEYIEIPEDLKPPSD